MRVKTPTILQMEAGESGAAALAIVLGYYKKFIPLVQLRVDAGVSRDGSKVSNILQAARQYGLEANVSTVERDAVWSLPLPAIASWNVSQFVVLEGAKRNRVYINDPQSGPRTIAPDEFARAFGGTVLTFKPGPQFTPGPPRIRFLASLRTLLAGSETAVLFLVLVVLGLVLPGIVVPAFAKIFVDDILVDRMQDWVGPLFVGMAATALIRGLLTWLQQRYVLRLETKLAISGSSRFLWHVLRLPMEFFSQRTAGDLTSRVQANDRVASLLSGDLATAAFNMITVLFFGAIMLTYHVSLSLIAFATAALNFAVLQYFSRLGRDGNQRLMQEQAKLMGASSAGLQIIETLKATGSESDFFAYWAGYQAKTVTAQQQLGTYQQILFVFPKFLAVLGYAIVVFVGALEVMRGNMSIGTVVAFQTLMASFFQPIDDFVEIGTRVNDAQADINRINDVLRYQADPYAAAVVSVGIGASTPSPVAAPLITSLEPQRRISSGPGAPLSKLTGYLEMRNVTFGYSRLSDPLLVDFCLQLKPGARVALVGASGSGKSTVANLVAGLYRPWSGEVLLDGIPLDQVPRWLVHNSLAAVNQDILLFEGSIADNLSMWDPTIERSTLMQAAKDAQIYDAVAARPGGFDAPVEEAGTNFSGGQRQRLEIARALVINPSILILDEATSALDSLTEQLIDDKLRRRGCTSLIIAHRLSTIRDSDEIIVLEQGKVVQRGTHDQMIQVDSAYRRLIEAA